MPTVPLFLGDFVVGVFSLSLCLERVDVDVGAKRADCRGSTGLDVFEITSCHARPVVGC